MRGPEAFLSIQRAFRSVGGYCSTMTSTTIPAIELRQLCHSYADTTVLRDLDLVIEQGEIFGFLGHNGAGKTTAVNILTTLLTPTSGSA